MKMEKLARELAKKESGIRRRNARRAKRTERLSATAMSGYWYNREWKNRMNEAEAVMIPHK